MPTDTTCFHVGIIGPSDTNLEVEAIQSAIGKLSSKLSRKGVSISAHHWSHLPPGIGEPQGYIDTGLAWADIDFVIGIMKKKFGTPVRNATSGTEHEVKLILELNAKFRTPDLLFYFHNECRDSSEQVRDFCNFLQSKALTAEYDDPNMLASSVCESLREKIDSKITKISGVPQSMGLLPANRRIVVEWILGAQMNQNDKSIPSIICFKNGNGEEFIYDCRVPNFQDFANWVMKSMGLAPKEGDCLLKYLHETSLKNVEKESNMSIAQLWLGNMFIITHGKMGSCEFKVAIGCPATGTHAKPMREKILKGVLPFPPKEIYKDTDGKLIYKL